MRRILILGRKNVKKKVLIKLESFFPQWGNSFATGSHHTVDNINRKDNHYMHTEQEIKPVHPLKAF